VFIMRRSLEITVNGTRHRIDDVAPHTSLSRWLRSQALTGTKEGCAEGDCGACTVAVAERDAEGRSTFRAINACIALLPMLDGKEVWTVEGLAVPHEHGLVPTPQELHPVQRAMVERYGSQCGYCTPGFVMSMPTTATCPRQTRARSPINFTGTSVAVRAIDPSATRCSTRSETDPLTKTSSTFD